jgi:hypothetical protein
MPSPTTTFIYRVESDKRLLATVARMYAESQPSQPLTLWREQLRYLLDRYGREVVIEVLTEDVPGMNMRYAMTLANLAERAESEQIQVEL